MSTAENMYFRFSQQTVRIVLLVSVIFLMVILTDLSVHQRREPRAESFLNTTSYSLVNNAITSGSNKEADFSKTVPRSTANSSQKRDKLIFPGTKWCGIGDSGKNAQDFGKFSRPDRCCQEHDKCQIYILPEVTKYGLLNSGIFLKSHCNCDKRFYDCLKSAKSFMANVIGCTYFNILKMRCFKKSRPIVGCARKKRGKCMEYIFGKDGDEIYQWFDNPRYF